MKKLVLVFIALATITFTSAAIKPFRIENTKVSIESIKKSKTFVLSLENIGNDAMTVELKDGNDVVFSAETVQNKKTYEKRFVLDRLSEGKYYLYITNSNSQTIQTLELTDDELIANENLRYTFNKPTVKYADDKLDLNILNTTDFKTKILIKDADQHEVFFEKVKNQVSIHRRYNLQDLPKGKYSVEVTAGNKSYTTVFEK